jgi:hypothetical protein
MTKLIVFTSLGALVCLPLMGASANYSFSTFDFPGAATTEVFGINDSGQFTGFWSAGGVTGSVRNGFLGLIGGSASTINDNNGFANTSPTGINNAGIIVGCAGTCSGLTAQTNTSFSFVGTTWTNFNPTSVVAAADFNGDGVPDVVWQNDTTRQVAVWYMGGAGGAVVQNSAFISSACVPGWSVVMAADFNKDGVPDVVWQSDTTRQVAVWYMGGSGGSAVLNSAFISSAGVPGWSVVD